MRKLNVNEFHRRALEVHGSKYEYDLETFTTRLEVVQIFCSEHGWFEQIVQNHSGFVAYYAFF